MSIPHKKYVAITSTTVKSTQAKYKELITRVLTTNPLFAANTVYEFTQSSDVAAFAGATSAEALFASEYFGWVSKRATQAKKISFMRYSFEALAPYMYSTAPLTPLATLKAVTDGAMTVNLGGTSYAISGVDLSAATSYADVASAVQTAIRGNTSGGSLWTAATVEYVQSPAGFVITGGATGANTINYATAPASGSDLSLLLGLNAASAPVISEGTNAQTITDVLNKMIDLSTNFATFGFLNAADATGNLDSIGAFIDEQNNQYRFCFDVSNANYSEAVAVAANHTGMTANYNINYGISGINPAWLMSAVLPATTDYTKPNGVKNYMFQEFPAQPVSVGLDGDGTLYQTLDNLNINYNGQTQKAGVKIAFYQNGFNTDGTDSAIYDNEIWLKDAITTDILNAFLALDFVSADDDGKAVIVGLIENDVDKALDNHVIANGKTLNSNQKAFITQLFDEVNAWLEVQNKGYKYEVEIVQEKVGNADVYIANYTLVYLKNDTIRKVTGSNILV